MERGEWGEGGGGGRRGERGGEDGEEGRESRLEQHGLTWTQCLGLGQRTEASMDLGHSLPAVIMPPEYLPTDMYSS